MAGHRTADVHDVVAAHLPAYQIGSVVPIGEGQDNQAYEVNAELIVRFRQVHDPAALHREARLLAAVAEVSPLPVPEPIFTDAQRRCLAYPKLPGVPLLDVSSDLRLSHGPAIASTLGALLSALHAVPIDRWTDLVGTDDQPLTQWQLEAGESYRRVAAHVPAAHRRAAEEFVGSPPPSDGYSPVFSHNDLGIEHVLVDPVTCTVTGIIDWSDAAIVDPAYDFGLLYRDLGPVAFRNALRAYRTDAVLEQRAIFYARCSVFEDLAYGLQTGRDAYVEKSRAAMAWLFPA